MNVKNFDGFFIAQEKTKHEYHVGTGDDFVMAIINCMRSIIKEKKEREEIKNGERIVGTYTPINVTNQYVKTEEGEEDEDD